MIAKIPMGVKICMPKVWIILILLLLQLSVLLSYFILVLDHIDHFVALSLF